MKAGFCVVEPDVEAGVAIAVRPVMANVR